MILTLAHVKAEGLKAYNENRLTAQHPDPEKRLCHYEVDHCNCVIGAAFDPETMDEVLNLELNEVTPLRCFPKDLVQFQDEDEKRIITHLQQLHDNWASASRTGKLDAIEKRDELLQALQS